MIEVICMDAKETTTGVKCGMDVDVQVILADGSELYGEVTLVRDEYDGQWTSYGPSADYWVSSELLKSLSVAGPETLRVRLDAILTAAAQSCYDTVGS
jgi:hypothetical protein